MLVVAHKVVSKAEGRVRGARRGRAGRAGRALAAEHGKDPRLVQAVLDETAELLRAERGVLICGPTTGSSAPTPASTSRTRRQPARWCCCPRTPTRSARALRAGIAALRGVRPAVVISDSFGRAWRLGQTDVAIGAAGLTPLDDWRGRRDAAAASCASRRSRWPTPSPAAADLARAKDSSEPAVLVRGLERFVTADDGPGAAALRRPPETTCFARCESGLSRPANGQPEEMTTRHQFISIPNTPQRGRTCQCLQPGSPMSSLATRTQRYRPGSSCISSIRRRFCSST